MMEKVTAFTIKQQKKAGKKITMLTAYDFAMAAIFDEAKIDMILVGDSMGSVFYGRPTTLEVTMEMAVNHCKAVSQGVKNYSMIVSDMPFGSFGVAQNETIKNAITSIQKEAPTWMLNHRKNYETGEDIHIIGPQIDLQLRDEINIMKKIRSYKGIRHERGLTVRGQRTRANSRKGLTLGVSKSRGR